MDTAAKGTATNEATTPEAGQRHDEDPSTTDETRDVVQTATTVGHAEQDKEEPAQEGGPPEAPGGRDTGREVLAAGNRLDDPPLPSQGEPDRQATDRPQPPHPTGFPPPQGWANLVGTHTTPTQPSGSSLAPESDAHTPNALQIHNHVEQAPHPATPGDTHAANQQRT